MEAKLEQHGDVTVVSFIGKLEMEKAAPLRELCLKNFKDRKVVFNLSHLSFVGSSGLSTFVETIRILSESSNEFKLAGAGLEFRRLINLTVNPEFSFFEDTRKAIESYQPTLSDDSRSA